MISSLAFHTSTFSTIKPMDMTQQRSLETLTRNISPPPRSRKSHRSSQSLTRDAPSPAAIEAGKAKIDDHLTYFSTKFQQCSREVLADEPRLSIEKFKTLYLTNTSEENNFGRGHFVIHQHNHPIAGTHYDLRLQFSQTSSISFAIPYGVPGNPNSRRRGRLAIETRVHNMWNHLIESASHATGSLLIWDTGEYSIVTKEQPKGPETDEEDLESTQGDDPDGVPEHEKLIAAFKQGSIRIRLRGSRLPQNYTISLRLSTLSKNQANFPKRHTPRKRHRKEGVIPPPTGAEDTVDSDSDLGTRSPRILSSPNLTSSSPLNTSAGIADASEDSSEETSIIRTNNAYTGATNSIGSIHRRQWFLTLDKANSGFVEVRTASGKKWTGGFEPFVVGGAEVERSVVTGRLCKDIMADEGVMGFVSRKNWKALVD